MLEMMQNHCRFCLSLVLELEEEVEELARGGGLVE